MKAPVDALGGKSLGETLLTPTKIYVKPVLSLMEKVNIKAVAHITGGGFYENIPRSLPDGLTAKIKRDDVRVLPIFDYLAQTGEISDRDMFNTFNMGVGMICIIDKEDAFEAISCLKEAGEDAYILGEVIEGEEGVILW